MTEQKIAQIFEQVGLAKIVRELANDELMNAVQSAMIAIAKPHLPEGINEAAEQYADKNCHNYVENESDRNELLYAFKACAG